MIFEDSSNNTEKTKNKLKQETQEVQNIYTIELTNIFSALHKKALENAEKAASNCTILNTALDGKGANVKFSGPGQHLIMALVKNDNDTISKDDALLAIKTYVQWFSGPENSEKITINDIKPQFVNKSDDEKNNSEEANSENKENNNKVKNESKNIKSFLNFIFESTQEEDEALAKENNQKIAGYYIEYEVEIGNDRGSSLDSAWKKIGKWADGIEFGAESLFSGGSGAKMTVGDMKKAFSKKIDADALTTAVSKQFRAKFPQLEQTQFSVFDTKTLINKLNQRLTAAIKSALKQVKNALCIKVNKTSDSYELISKQEIADLVTKSMKSSDKLVGNKNQVNKNDVYLINNYDENKKEQKKVDEPIKKESFVVQSLLKKIFEDILIEEEPEKNNKNTEDEKNQTDTKESNEKLVDDITKEIKNTADNEVKTAQLPFAVEDEETKVWIVKELIKQLKDNGVSDPTSISELEKYENALVVKLSKTVGNQDDKGDDIEDRSDDDEQLGTGESLITNVYNKLLTEAAPAEQIKKQLLDVGKKIFDKVVSKFKDNLSENDSNEIINVEYENPTESIIIPSFNTFLLEAGKHTAAHIKQLIDKVGSKQIISNKDEIIQTIKDYYSNNKESEDTKEKLLGTPEKMVKKRDENGKIIKYTKDDERKSKGKHKKGEAKLVKQEAKPGILDDFFKLSDDDSMKKWVDNEFAEINKDSKDELPVQAFWKALSLLPEKEDNKDTIKITFKDIDDPSKIKNFEELTDKDKEQYEQLGDPIEVKPGEKVEAPEIKEKEGYKFDHWDPEPSEMKEDGDTYAIYQSDNEESTDKDTIKITFRDIDDPSQIDDFTSLTSQDKEKYKQIGDPIEVTPGEDFDIPEVEEKEGYKFDHWDPEPSEMKEDGDTYAMYQEDNKDQDDESAEDDSIKPYQYLILPKNIENSENNQNSKNNTIGKSNISINKTEWDCYIIPMKNLEFVSAKEDAEKSKA